MTILWQPDLEMGPLSAPAEQAAAATPENPALTTMTHNFPQSLSYSQSTLWEAQSTDNQTSTRTSPPSQQRGPETVRSADPPSDATISDPTQSYRVGHLPNGWTVEYFTASSSNLSFPLRVITMPRGTILGGTTADVGRAF